MSRARTLSFEEACRVTRDARVVAIRWDLVEWALVLDLDAPVSEGAAVPMSRVWLVFDEVSDVSWPMVRARLPTGCWLGTPIEAVSSGDEHEFRVGALLPRFGDDGVMENAPTQTVIIKARAVWGVQSQATAVPGEFGLAAFDRVRLATDEEMLGALARETPGCPGPS